MKKLLLLTSLLGVIVLAGCGAKTQTTTTVNVVNTGAIVKTYETTGFSIQYPATRAEQENVYGANVMFFTPQASGDLFRENVGIVTEILPSAMTVADYYTSIKSQLTTIIKDYQEISNEDITLNGIAAKKIIYIGTQSNYKLKWEQVLLIKDKTAYVINYTASADTFTQFTTEVDAMVNSFTLK